MSHFDKDIASEEILGKYLSEQYAKANLNTARNRTLDLQYKGVDIIITGGDTLSYKVDEKAQLHYLNTDLPTFALEIDYIKDKQIKLGWLYDHTKVTELYAFVFSIHVFDRSEELKSVQNIKSCDVVFVNRIRLLNELSLLNIDLNYCRLQSNILRSSSTNKLTHKSGFNFQISNHLSEKPVNLVVRKSFLVKIGKQYYFPIE